MNMWLAGSDNGSEANWYWVDDPTPFSYTHWHGNQPDNWGGGQNCMIYLWSGGVDAWDDKFCTGPWSFICEAAFITVRHTFTTDSQTSTNIPPEETSSQHFQTLTEEIITSTEHGNLFLCF